MAAGSNKYVCPIVWASVGVAITIAASVIIGIGTVDQLINNIINKELVISLDSAVFDQWMSPPPPIYMQYWFFNVTNPQQVVAGEKPKLQQLGPLTYRLYQPRFDVAFYTNSTVQYKYNHTLVYQPHLSQIAPDQHVIQLNLPLITVDTMVKQQSLPSMVQKLIVDVVKGLKDDQMFVNHTAEEFLFGYDDPIFTEVNKFVKDLVPPQFGLFYGYNNSDDGVYLVNTGHEKIKNVNLIERWNFNKTLNWWGTAEANMINGTDGVFMNSGITKNDTLYIYNSDICRSIYIVFEKETKVQGIKTWRFRVPDQVFESPLKNKDNQGFCIGFPDNCLLDGVLEIAVCKQGAPVVMSCPHFYMADPSYLHAVDGLKPVKEIHETYLDVEPMTGAVFQANKRLQANILLKPSTLFDQLKKINETIFPIAWLNESVTLDENTSNTFKSQVLRNIRVAHAMEWLLLSIGLVMFIVATVTMTCRKFLAKEEYSPLKIENNDSKSSSDA